jgi:outer membrane lipopolysaccharide assembly protein LptE/RlpB
MSGLMVEIDEMLDAEEFTSQDAATVRTEVENLIISGSDKNSEFPQKYRDALQADPHVVMEHANTRKVISVLPKSNKGQEGGEKGNGHAM